MQIPLNFPSNPPSSRSEYALENSHPNTRGNFVLSLYESLRKIPRTSPYISPWKPFPRCGEFFSNPSSNHLNINWKIYSLLSSLASRLGPAQHSLTSPSFCTGPASCWSPIEPPSPCPTGPSRTPQAQLASRAAHQSLGLALPQAPLANPRRGQLPVPPPPDRVRAPDRAPWLRCPRFASRAPLPGTDVKDGRHLRNPSHPRP